MRRLRENLLLQFSVASFAVLAFVAVALAIILTNKIRSDAIDDLVNEAVGQSSGRLLRAITPADLEVPMTGERYDRFHKFVQQSIVSDRTARVKLWAKDGTVIYSNDPTGVGEKFPAKENLLTALRGENAIEIKIPKDAENAREEYLGTLMEVYTPVIFPGTTEPQGAFEIYQYYAPTAQRIDSLRAWVFGSTSVGFLAIYIGLVSIVWRGSRTITGQRSQLEAAYAELKQTQQNIIQQERLRALGEMASGIAHDFNNALTPILGFSELLLKRSEGLDDRDTVERYLRMMNMAAQDAATVVSRLREFYRKREEGENFAPASLHDLVGQAISLTQPRWKDEAQAKGITIKMEIDLQEVPLIIGDESELREALTNLVFNAVDAMPDGGTITLRTRRDGNQVVLEVSDTGTGMTEEVRQRCLDPFFTTKGTHGTGMGLAMVYGIVQRHEGTLDIESEADKGTTLILS